MNKFNLFQVSVERLIMMPHILTMANQLLTVEISNDVSTITLKFLEYYYPV